MSASTWSPPRPALMRTGPPSRPSRARRAKSERFEDAARVLRQRQQADEDVGAGEEGDRAPPRPKRSAMPSIAPRRAAPAGDVEAHHPSLRAASCPSTPSPMMPTRTSCAAGLEAVVEPELLRAAARRRRRCWRRCIEAMQHDVLAHAVRQVGVDDAHDRHVGQLRVADEMVDAGAEREQHLRGSASAARLPGGCFQEAA